MTASAHVPSLLTVTLSKACIASVCWLLLCISTLALLANGAQADTPQQVRIEADGCPSAHEVETMLAPLLGASFGLSDRPASSDDVLRVAVRDLGVDYSVELPGGQRSYRDPTRDCQERARVAAVFLALNLQAQQPTQPVSQAQEVAASAVQPTNPQSATKSEAERAVESTSPLRLPLEVASYDRPSLGVGLYGTFALAPARAAVAGGGSFTFWARLARFQLQLRGAVLSRVKLHLSPRAPGGTAWLARIPLVLEASYVLHRSRYELLPTLGIVLDVLRVRGAGLDRSVHALRSNVGLDVGAQGTLWLGARVGLSVALHGSWFPRAYALRVEPDARIARTPRGWLASQLGIVCMLR